MAQLSDDLLDLVKQVKEGMTTVSFLVHQADGEGWVLSSINNVGEHGQTMTFVRDGDPENLDEHGFPKLIWLTV